MVCWVLQGNRFLSAARIHDDIKGKELPKRNTNQDILFTKKNPAETLIKEKKKRFIVNPISFTRYHGISPNTAFSLLNASAEMVSLPLSTNTCLSECLCQLSCTAFYLYTQYMFSYLCLSFARVGRHWSGVYHSMATGHRTRSRRSAKEKTCGQE